MSDSNNGGWIAYKDGVPVGERSEVGNATAVVNGGKVEYNHGLAPLAYTAGGGALAYFLAKALLGGGDEKDKDGNKKKPGFWKSIAPYLAAAAGAVGGYSLSGIGDFKVGPKDDDKNGGAGRSGEVLVPKGDGYWSGGRIAYTGGAGALAAAGTARAAGRHYVMRPDIAGARINALAKTVGQSGKTLDELRNFTGGKPAAGTNRAAFYALKDEIARLDAINVARSARAGGGWTTPGGIADKSLTWLGKPRKGRLSSLRNSRGVAGFLTALGLEEAVRNLWGWAGHDKDVYAEALKKSNGGR